MALDQLDQYQRIDRGLGFELDLAAVGAGIDFLDAEFFRLQLEQGQAHQVLGRVGQQAEAVDHLDLQVLEAVFVHR
ncbi:hypothetical protein D3C75_1218070 [compost metagenome]